MHVGFRLETRCKRQGFARIHSNQSRIIFLQLCWTRLRLQDTSKPYWSLSHVVESCLEFIHISISGPQKYVTLPTGSSALQIPSQHKNAALIRPITVTHDFQVGFRSTVVLSYEVYRSRIL
jgi:hypothetical protein